jgi:hypothetical protein
LRKRRDIVRDARHNVQAVFSLFLASWRREYSPDAGMRARVPRTGESGDGNRRDCVRTAGIGIGTGGSGADGAMAIPRAAVGPVQHGPEPRGSATWGPDTSPLVGVPPPTGPQPARKGGVPVAPGANRGTRGGKPGDGNPVRESGDGHRRDLRSGGFADQGWDARNGARIGIGTRGLRRMARWPSRMRWSARYDTDRRRGDRRRVNRPCLPLGWPSLGAIRGCHPRVGNPVFASPGWRTGWYRLAPGATGTSPWRAGGSWGFGHQLQRLINLESNESYTDAIAIPFAPRPRTDQSSFLPEGATAICVKLRAAVAPSGLSGL